jgi:hypothetical protein
MYLLVIEAKECRCRGVDVVDMLGATQTGTASGYLTTELERLRRREHVVDMPTVSYGEFVSSVDVWHGTLCI